MRRLVLVLTIVIALGLAGCGTPFAPGVRTYPTSSSQLNPGLTMTPASLTPVSALSDEAILADAKQITIAMLSIHYQDLPGWQTRLYPLSTTEGQRFWNTNVSSGLLAGVVTDQRVTQAVVIERASVEQLVSQADRRAAFVAVSGKVTYQDKTGVHTTPFAQRMMLMSVENHWKFVTLLIP